MKRLLMIMTLVMFSMLAFGQYTASNGVTYNVGDTLTIGKGSAQDGSFMFIQLNGAAMLTAGGSNELNMGKHYTGLKAVVKKVVMKKLAGQTKPCLTVTLKPFSYIIYIEEAIESGELKK